MTVRLAVKTVVEHEVARQFARSEEWFRHDSTGDLRLLWAAAEANGLDELGVATATGSHGLELVENATHLPVPDIRRFVEPVRAYAASHRSCVPPPRWLWEITGRSSLAICGALAALAATLAFMVLRLAHRHDPD